MMSLARRCAQSRVAPLPRARGGGGLGRIAGEPFAHVVMVELLRPEHAGQRLPLDEPHGRDPRWVPAGPRRTRPPRAARRRTPRRNPRRLRPARTRRAAAAAGSASPPGRGAGRSGAAHLVPGRPVGGIGCRRRRRSGRSRPCGSPPRGPLPNRRWVLVSFSVNSQSVAASAKKRIGGMLGMARPAPSRRIRPVSSGRGTPCFHDQVLRAQSCGSSVRSAGSGPRLVAVTRISTSSGAGLGVGDLDIEVAAVRRTGRCRAARIPGRRGRAGHSPRPGAHRETRPADTCRASA